ncbi:MAG: response regulator [Xenococcaceae cyanobacterium MO_188.B32]|nr:response regulator [Xenococcaceae cyanobacterium MO_188.B32]
MSVKILIADDEIKANSVVQKSYKKQINNIVDFAGDGEEALKIIEANKSSLDLALVDLKMYPMGGIELINYLADKQIPIKIIAISAYVSPDEVKKYFTHNENILGFLEKPFDINKLKKIIQDNFTLDSSTQIFDYSQLEEETSVFVREQTEEIRGLMKRTAQGIRDIGQKLLEIKEKLGHGNFLNWLKAEFNWSEPTAQRFMQVARQFESIKLMDLSIAPSALYVLSAPSTPDSVREEAISRAQAGENITYTAAKEIKQKYQPVSTNKVKKDEKIEKEREKTPAEPESRSVSDVKFSILDKPRTRASEPSRKQEILAVIPKQTTDQGETVVRSGSWYQLGKEHLLYCGEPNSPQFKKRLPKEIALSIAFPPTPKWHLATPVEANSEVVFFSRYQDLDLITLKEMVQRALELYTEDKESIIFSFLPEPELLILAHQLGCRCFIAEPDFRKCEATLAMWKKKVGFVAKT